MKLHWVFTLASSASNFACINILPTPPIAAVTNGTWSGRTSSCCTYICTNIYAAHVSVFERVYVGIYVYVLTLRSGALVVTATHCNTLQHTATHCNTLQHTATHCNTLQHTTTLVVTAPIYPCHKVHTRVYHIYIDFT